MGADLSLSMKIQRGSQWIELEDPGNGYELHGETMGSRAITHRKTEVESAWLEGSYTQRSLRSNITEALVVYCTGDSHGDMMQRMELLTSALDQDRFKIRVQVEDYVTTWLCQSSDYTIETGQELLTARHAIVKAQVPRLPRSVS